MKIPVSDKVKNEYRDPVHFMDNTEYKKRRKQLKRRGIIAGAIGLTVLILAPIFYANGDLQQGSGINQTASKNNFGLLLVSLGLALYGLYQLMTINKQIKKG